MSREFPTADEEYEADEPHESEERDEVEGAEGERLQKLIARAGIASRRAAEELISQGRVSINGHVIKELGAKADPDRDRILVDGKPLRFRTGPSTVVLLHKPRGVVTTKNDPEKRSTVYDLLPRQYQHVHPVGRLDYDTAGILLLTDDGELTQMLTHPSHGVEKVYSARVRGLVPLTTIKKLEAGIYLEDGKTAPCRIRMRAQTENNSLVELTLHEGRNRQVRRMLEAVGHPVSALRRIRFGGLDLEGVPVGTFRVLLPGEVNKLHKLAEAKPSTKTGPKKPRAFKTKSAKTSKPKTTPSQTAAAKMVPAKGTSAKPAQSKPLRPQATASKATSSKSTASKAPQPRGAQFKITGTKTARVDRSSQRTTQGQSPQGPTTQARPGQGRPAQQRTPQGHAAQGQAARGRPAARTTGAGQRIEQRSTNTPPARLKTFRERTAGEPGQRKTGHNQSTPQSGERSRKPSQSSARDTNSQSRQNPLARRIEQQWKRNRDA